MNAHLLSTCCVPSVVLRAFTRLIVRNPCKVGVMFCIIRRDSRNSQRLSNLSKITQPKASDSVSRVWFLFFPTLKSPRMGSSHSRCEQNEFRWFVDKAGGKKVEALEGKVSFNSFSTPLISHIDNEFDANVAIVCVDFSIIPFNKESWCGA